MEDNKSTSLTTPIEEKKVDDETLFQDFKPSEHLTISMLCDLYTKDQSRFQKKIEFTPPDYVTMSLPQVVAESLRLDSST